MIDHRIASTPDLQYLSKVAVRQELNRAATDVAMARLDPDGLHVLFRRLAFMNDGSGLHRCLVLAKIVGDDEPVEFYLDVEEKYWQRLRTKEELDAAVGSVP